MDPHRRRQLRFFLHRWHRRVGLAAALLIILAGLTGIALNHSGGLNLATSYPQSGVLLLPYRTLMPDVRGFPTESGLMQVKDNILYVGNTALVECHRLTGYAAATARLVACADSWHLLDGSWHLIESFDPILADISATGLPAVSDDQLAVVESDHESGDAMWFYFDDNDLMKSEPVAPGILARPELLSGQNDAISWQRVLLDLHSGRWFGAWGVWVMDAAAITMLLLSLSGFWLWWSRRRNRM